MKRQTGEDYILHSVRVAYILANMKMNPLTIGCALIHEAITLDKRSKDNIKEKFGEETSVILESISKISSLRRTFKIENNVDKYRRIIVGLSDNPIALFIKFADRLDNLRSLYVHDEEHIKEAVEETENILIPIAHRLGMKSIQSEMEDLCLQYGDKENYNNVKNRIAFSKDELERALSKMEENLKELLTQSNIKDYTLKSRVKSVNGVYNKLKTGRKWEQIHDLLGLRIIVNTVEECYQIIGLIHSKYEAIPKRFKDYIAKPKPNMYQSVHTTITDEESKEFEIQVRTYEMDEIAEGGVAAHWSYKEKVAAHKSELENRLETFRALIERNDLESNMDFFGNIGEELKRKEIYVFTPKGDIIELPQNATPIDYAYKIHSEVGHNTTSALVNNKMKKLDHELQDGDIVELITQKGKAPNREWLNFVKTDNARSRIKAYFYKAERDKYVSLGIEMLENECKKRNLELKDLLTEESINKATSSLKLDSIEDIYFSVSTLRNNPNSVINKFIIEEKTKPEITQDYIEEHESDANVIVAGQTDIMSSFATCCSPVYGEAIVGYVSKGNGVKIHSKECPNIDPNGERILEVKWNKNLNDKFLVKLKVFIDSEEDIIMYIINIATKKQINIESINFASKEKQWFYDIKCKVKDIGSLNVFIDETRELNAVARVERVYS